MTSKAFVVLSGGQDSTSCLFWARAKWGAAHVTAITFDYDQRHRRELEAALTVAELAGVKQYTVVLGAILSGTSPLTDKTQPLEQYETAAQMADVIGDRVEKTFVPMRNALFLTAAANHAYCDGAMNLVTGVCQEDNANYPDCRESFLFAQEDTINTALGIPLRGGIPDNWNRDDVTGSVAIHAPLIRMTKAESIRWAMGLPGAYSALAYSHTAYDGAFPPIGRDHATLLRAQGFEEAGVPDPLILRCVRLGLMDLPISANYAFQKREAAFALIREEMKTAGRLERWWTL